jgi:hypothetical protein
MSYSGIGAITVGHKAQSDLVMAEASLRAAQIVEAASRARTKAEKHRIVQRRLDAIGAGVAARASREYRRLIAAGKAEDQATFDAMRLAIANWMIDEVLRIAAEYQPGASGLGGPWKKVKKAFSVGRDIACVGGAAAAVYAPPAGQAIAAAQDAAGCNRRSQKAARRTAREQTAQAQAALAAAQANAEAERLRAQREATRGSTMTKVALIGGGVAVVGLGVWLMLRKS